MRCMVFEVMVSIEGYGFGNNVFKIFMCMYYSWVLFWRISYKDLICRVFFVVCMVEYFFIFIRWIVCVEFFCIYVLVYSK